MAAGSAFIGGGLQLHADYVLHPWILQDRDSFVLPVYFGPGRALHPVQRGTRRRLALRHRPARRRSACCSTSRKFRSTCSSRSPACSSTIHGEGAGSRSTPAPACATTSECSSRSCEARTADGVTLRIDRVAARGARRGVVLCLHAMMTDGRYFGARRDGGFAAHSPMPASTSTSPTFAATAGRCRRAPVPTTGASTISSSSTCRRSSPRRDESQIRGRRARDPRALARWARRVRGARHRTHRAAARARARRDLGVARRDRRSAARSWRAYRGVTALLGRAPIRALRVGTADESASYVQQLTGWAKQGRWTSLRGIDYIERARDDHDADVRVHRRGRLDVSAEPMPTRSRSGFGRASRFASSDEKRRSARSRSLSSCSRGRS